MFEDYLARWELTPDGDPILTHTSQLLPVRQHGVPAMLKITHEAEEKFGGVMLAWWDGQGAAPVLAQHGDALLLERATGGRSLAELARQWRDEEATRILCSVLATLHAPRPVPPPGLVPLKVWFRELEPAAARYGGILARAAAMSQMLRSRQREVVPLHGDLHHENVLDFGSRGWLAIDPKRLTGDRAFDYANIFSNPDHAAATGSGVFARRVAIVCETARLDRERLLSWILAWSGLSAAWWLGDGVTPETALAIAELAAAALDGQDLSR